MHKTLNLEVQFDTVRLWTQAPQARGRGWGMERMEWQGGERGWPPLPPPPPPTFLTENIFLNFTYIKLPHPTFICFSRFYGWACPPPYKKDFTCLRPGYIHVKQLVIIQTMLHDSFLSDIFCHSQYTKHRPGVEKFWSIVRRF